MEDATENIQTEHANIRSLQRALDGLAAQRGFVDANKYPNLHAMQNHEPFDPFALQFEKSQYQMEVSNREMEMEMSRSAENAISRAGGMGWFLGGLLPF